jgi:hypothetical protein
MPYGNTFTEHNGFVKIIIIVIIVWRPFSMLARVGRFPPPEQVEKIITL